MSCICLEDPDMGHSMVLEMAVHALGFAVYIGYVRDLAIAMDKPGSAAQVQPMVAVHMKESCAGHTQVMVAVHKLVQSVAHMWMRSAVHTLMSFAARTRERDVDPRIGCLVDQEGID